MSLTLNSRLDFAAPIKAFGKYYLCGGESDLAGSRVNPHVPRLRCGQAAESALSTRKSPAGQNSSKNVTRPLGARVGCRLDAIAYIKMKKNRAESRFEELCRGQYASCIAEPASWTCKPLKRNFEEISTKREQLV